jgi:bifunctional non-homologous end joining protein LigD
MAEGAGAPRPTNRGTRRGLILPAVTVYREGMPPLISPMPLRRIGAPFDDPDWIFEIKYDGFRALSYLNEARCRLVSRKGNEFRSFTALSEELASSLPVSAVLDGEIVCLDRDGRPQFYNLLYHRASPVFVAFDILWRGQEDLRHLPLVDRKQELRGVLARSKSTSVLYADHIDGKGIALFERV